MNLTTKVSLRVIAVFICAILTAILADKMHIFFGDEYCQGNLLKQYCQNGWDKSQNKHGATWHWAYGHWLFFFMGISLFIIQIVDIINLIYKKK